MTKWFSLRARNFLARDLRALRWPGLRQDTLCLNTAAALRPGAAFRAVKEWIAFSRRGGDPRGPPGLPIPCHSPQTCSRLEKVMQQSQRSGSLCEASSRPPYLGCSPPSWWGGGQKNQQASSAPNKLGLTFLLHLLVRKFIRSLPARPTCSSAHPWSKKKF